jgi:hypothetical protein
MFSVSDTHVAVDGCVTLINNSIVSLARCLKQGCRCHERVIWLFHFYRNCPNKVSYIILELCIKFCFCRSRIKSFCVCHVFITVCTKFENIRFWRRNSHHFSSTSVSLFKCWNVGRIFPWRWGPFLFKIISTFHNLYLWTGLSILIL